ncbi:hypothetical protein F2Q70_00036304 [Brassica cretica]|uniref:Uncharacterized protein n=2 Tax=Brassica cretica TaxID=69181 RepID=A0A8S9JYY8_BRACR|nr:hypothetical protein F2Q70_00036304 [Brassica cretica]KAF3591221.1 hypothetical protein DY000_02025212 [Brassica cretica]KAF3598336.1 hypothetical protein F2Q69_00036558 [Brassica cretica]
MPHHQFSEAERDTCPLIDAISRVHRFSPSSSTDSGAPASDEYCRSWWKPSSASNQLQFFSPALES